MMPSEHASSYKDLFSRGTYTTKSLLIQIAWTVASCLAILLPGDSNSFQRISRLVIVVYNLEERSRSWLNSPRQWVPVVRSTTLACVIIAVSIWGNWLPAAACGMNILVIFHRHVSAMVHVLLLNPLSGRSTRVVDVLTFVESESDAIKWSVRQIQQYNGLIVTHILFYLAFALKEYSGSDRKFVFLFLTFLTGMCLISLLERALVVFLDDRALANGEIKERFLSPCTKLKATVLLLFLCADFVLFSHLVDNTQYVHQPSIMLANTDRMEPFSIHSFPVLNRVVKHARFDLIALCYVTFMLSRTVIEQLLRFRLWRHFPSTIVVLLQNAYLSRKLAGLFVRINLSLLFWVMSATLFVSTTVVAKSMWHGLPTVLPFSERLEMLVWAPPHEGMAEAMLIPMTALVSLILFVNSQEAVSIPEKASVTSFMAIIIAASARIDGFHVIPAGISSIVFGSLLALYNTSMAQKAYRKAANGKLQRVPSLTIDSVMERRLSKINVPTAVQPPVATQTPVPNASANATNSPPKELRIQAPTTAPTPMPSLTSPFPSNPRLGSLSSPATPSLSSPGGDSLKPLFFPLRAPTPTSLMSHSSNSMTRSRSWGDIPGTMKYRGSSLFASTPPMDGLAEFGSADPELSDFLSTITLDKEDRQLVEESGIRLRELNEDSYATLTGIGLAIAPVTRILVGLKKSRKQLNSRASFSSAGNIGLALEEPLDTGGYGDIWKATYNGSVVIAKHSKGDHLDGVRAFEREVSHLEKLKTINHPCIVGYRGHVCFPPDMYLLLEYVPRGSLRNVIHRGDLPPELHVRCMWEIASGMQCLQELGIIHRDSNTSNVLVDQEFHCKVADFGLAREKSGNSLTLSVGHVRYMAPEMTDTSYGPSVDVWCFAFIIYDIYEGEIPFSWLPDIRVAYILQRGIRPAVSSREIPPRIRRLMEMCWVKEANERPSFAQVLQILDSEYEEPYFDDSKYRIDLVSPSTCHAGGGTTVRLSGKFMSEEECPEIAVSLAGISNNDIVSRSTTEIVIVTKPITNLDKDSITGDCVVRMGKNFAVSSQLFAFNSSSSAPSELKFD